ncbi:MAG: DNA repair protein RecO [Candidatus Moranbacteria bacterium]|nr:DNA repair protein RecO [Candidatus Moranbacteria bacterium]
MHHHIYHTQGFILSSRNVGEANKMITIFTRELGLVRAMVQGVRLNKSKLKYILQDFSYANIDFVKGKEVWRVTSAKSINTFPLARANKESLLLIARISSLIDRFCGAESVNQKIFDELIQSMYVMDDYIENETREALELHLVLRIMNELGYIGDSSLLMKYLGSSFDKEKTKDLLKERQSIIAHINKALMESQL